MMMKQHQKHCNADLVDFFVIYDIKRSKRFLFIDI